MPSPVSTAALRQRAPRLAEAAVERARLTVVPRARTRAARVPFVSLVTLLLLGGVVGLLLFNTSMQQSSFTATSLEQRATLLSAREESLGMQLENLRDPQVVARKAQQLGMRVPAAPLFLDLADGSVEGDPAGARIVSPRPAARPSLLDPPATVVAPAEGVLSDGRGDAAAAERGGRNGAEARAEKRAEKQAKRAEKQAKKAEKKAKKAKKAAKEKAKKKAEQRAKKNRDA